MMLSERYELGASIGTGGMSEVYAAEDTLLGRQVAIKIMRTDLARDTSFRERFRREGLNAGRLNHPSVVSVFDTGEVNMHGIEVPYIVMELVQGRTLREIVKENGPLRPADAARVLIPVCSALQVSHDAGIIHRDIKPANIMITSTGAVKVMDFGIARAIDDNTAAMTQTSAVIGTAQYLSPEQARGKTAQAASDIYALGCVLYETLTGQPPFAGDTPFAVAFQHVHEDPEPPSSYIPDLTPSEALNVNAVVLTAMAKHPGDRYSSAAEFAADLELLARNAVTHAARMHVTAEPADPPTEIVTRQVATPAAAAQPQVQLPPQAATNGIDIFNEPTVVTQSQQPRRRGAGLWLGGLVGAVLLGGGLLYGYEYFIDQELLPGMPASSSDTAATLTMPQVTGLPQVEAATQLSSAGFQVTVVEQASPTVDAGLVLSSSPAAGSQLPTGAPVTLTVSSGKEVTEVPNLRGMTTEQAAHALAAAGLELETKVVEESSDKVEKGQVISHLPSQGSRVSKGTKVEITVSTGPSLAAVPELRNLQWDLVERNLSSLGFVPQVKAVDGVAPEGTVLSVEGEGQELPKGSTVVVEISRGNQITTPNLVGLNFQGSLAALRAAGWTGADGDLKSEQVASASLVEQGLVAWQLPPVGTPLFKDSPVSVGINYFDLATLVGR